MKNLSLIAAILITLVMGGLSRADPQERAERIRKEYRGPSTPDHIAFTSLLLSIQAANERNQDIAFRRVQAHMRLNSEEATETFLSRMLAAAARLHSENAKMKEGTLCGPDVPRDKEALYRRLDQVDDLREIKFHNAYVRFTSSLNEKQQKAMTAWLEERKEGLYYRTAKHKSLFENAGTNVVGHVETLCASLRGNEQ